MNSLALATNAAPRARLTLAIYDLGCGGGGVLTIERALIHVPGVIRVYANPATEMAYIEYNSAMTHPDQLIAAVTASGFHAGELGSYSSGPVGSAASLTAEWTPRVDWAAARTMPIRMAGSRRRLVSYWLFVLAGLILLGLLVVLAIVRFPGPPHTAHYTINLDPAGFQPATLVVPAGQMLYIQLNNVDAALPGRTVGNRHQVGGPASSSRHQFAIQELGINVRLDAGQSTTLTLPPLRPGAYHFVCTLSDHPQTTQELRGTLLVHEAGSDKGL